MKKDKLYISLEIAKWIFFLALPIALFIWKCTTIGNADGGTKFITSCCGYIVCIIIYIIFKKAIMKNYVKELNGKIVNYYTQLETETDQEKITLIENALKKCLIIRDIFNLVPILIACALILLIVKALEKDIITMYSVLGFITLSCLMGFGCTMAQDWNIKSKNRVNEEEEHE